MRGIGGNTTGIIETRTGQKNAIGEHVLTWAQAVQLRGWLDLSTGEARTTTYNAKIQESTHVFLCDYTPLPDSVTAENARMTIGGKHYDVLLIDNPMEMGSGSQLEIYLKYTGGQ